MRTVVTFGLTPEEREDLALLTDSAQWIVAMKLLQAILKVNDEKVLTYNLLDGAEKLVHEKARSEGAHRLARDFENAALAITKRELQQK